MQNREFQQTSRQWGNRELNQGNHPLLVSPAGTGKTYIATLLIKDRIKLKKRMLVLVGTEEIFDQWIEDCIDRKINYGYINQEGVIGRGKNVYICMWQSLSNLLQRLPEKFVNSFDEIIIDEAHHCASPTLERIFEHFKKCQLLLLTATPYRMDNKPLGKYANKIHIAITQKESAEKGYLCKPIIIMPNEYKMHSPNNIKKINMTEQKKYIHSKKIIGDIIKIYKDVFNGELIMVPCSSHSHAVEITEMYRNEGWIVEHIHGKLDKTARRSIIRRAREGKINILTTYDVGKEGLNIKNIKGVLWLRLTESLVTWIQMNTRAARIIEGKTHYIIIDPMGNILLHGSPDIDREWSLYTDYTPGQDIPETPTTRICPNCSVVNSIELNQCWICGYDWKTGMIDGVLLEKKKRRLPTMIDGELVYLDDDRMVENERRKENNNDLNNIDNTSDNNEHIDSDIPVLKKSEKLAILQGSLTGVGAKNKFKEGLKWL